MKFVVAYLHNGQFPAYSVTVFTSYVEAFKACDKLYAEGHSNPRVYVFGSDAHSLN